MPETFETDIAIIGGGFGAIAAALAATERGYRVIITDEFAWIGGQVTSQALCVPDELYDPSGETIINRRYAAFRERIRHYYTSRYKLSALGKSQLYFSPGNSACSPTTAEPQVAHQIIHEMLSKARDRGLIRILPRHVPIAAEVRQDQVQSVTCRDLDHAGAEKVIRAKFFLDGTEAGDTYPLLGLEYRIGSEARSEFQEPHAPAKADPTTVQCFTYCIMAEFVPGGNFTVAKPAGYEQIRDAGDFHLCCLGQSATERGKFFDLKFRADGGRIIPFWYYRCVIDVRNFDDPAVRYGRAVINVGCNDFAEEAYVDNPNKEQVLARARNLSLSYLYWLQTEAPRDDGGFGYPELRPLPESTGTSDGIAQGPYVREGRRLKACQTVIEQDISTQSNATARARIFDNSVGLGSFLIDIHGCSGSSQRGMAQMTRPYQIPLGALVSPQLKNFAVANKGIGVTQITNGAYRLHPVEWNIGEAAGELAAYCLEHRVAHPNLTGRQLFEYQRRLIQNGTPLYWYEDVPYDHPGFEAAQLLAVTGLWPGAPEHLRFEPQQSICRHRPMFLKVMGRLREMGVDATALRDLHVIAHNFRKIDAARQCVILLDEKGWPKAAMERSVPAYAPADHTPLDPAVLW